jgi:hypothetical protein
MFLGGNITVALEGLDIDGSRAVCPVPSRAMTLAAREKGVKPFSSKDRSAIQTTDWTLTPRPSPAVSALERLQSSFTATGKSELGVLLHNPELIQAKDEFTFYFNHEVPIMDRAGFRMRDRFPLLMENTSSTNRKRQLGVY